jgi:rhodanese-related sulfurtransferase
MRLRRIASYINRMSKKHTPRPTQNAVGQARLAQLAGFAAGAILVLAVAFFIVKRSSTPDVAAAAAVPVPAAVPAALPAGGADDHQHPTDFPRVSAEELKALAAKGAVTVIDVRDIDSFLAGHIPGSLHIPVSLIEGEIAFLPKDKPIVTYCTCPAEESSGAAAQILQHGGITNVAALVGGLDAWKQLGGGIETGRPPAPAAGQ